MRGRPGPDDVWRSKAPDPKVRLDRYAAERGLEWHRNTDTVLVPYAPFFDFAEDRNFNTLRGTWPDGTFAVAGHRRREEKVRSGGGSPSYNADTGGVDGGESVTRVQEAHTFAAVPAPETKATLRAASIYASQLVSATSGVRFEPAPARGDWRVAVHPRADAGVLEALWSCPAVAAFRERYPWQEPSGFRGAPGPGGKIEVRAGILAVWVPGYLEGGELDGLVAMAAQIGREIAAACVPPGTPPKAFDHPLPAPAGWGAWSRPAAEDLGGAIEGVKLKRVRRGKLDAGDISDPGASDHERWGAVRDFAHAYAAARGMEVEDGAAFDRAFPRLPFTGHTQFACRGRRPDGAPLRVGVSAVRSYLWGSWEPAGGAAFAVAPAPPGTPDQPLRVDPASKLHVAVGDGLQLVARYVIPQDTSFAELDRLAATLR